LRWAAESGMPSGHEGASVKPGRLMGGSGAGPGKPKILYIAGWGRSGTTIVGGILGHAPGFFHGGEILYLAKRGREGNYLCGCGEPLRECKVWNEVLTHVGRHDGSDTLDLLAEIQDQVARTRRLPILLGLGRFGITARKEERLVRLLTELYSKIQETTQARWIVDSSKSPAYGRLLSMSPDLDVYVLHLIRDPRATGVSWRKWKYDAAARGYLDRYGRVKNVTLWMVWNAFIEAFWNRRETRARYHRLRYETFAARPREAIQAVFDFVGSPEAQVPWKEGDEIEMSTSHTVGGNPVRMRTGTIRIATDSEWRNQVTGLDRVLVSGLAWPLLLRYGYPLWVGGRDR